MEVGNIYLNRYWRMVLVLDLQEWTGEDEWWVKKGDKWAMVMYCHTEFDMLTNKDLKVDSKWVEELPIDLVIEGDTFSSMSRDFDLFEPMKVGRLDDHVMECLTDLFNGEVVKSRYHVTGPKMSRGCPLWNFKKSRLETMHQMVQL